MGLHVWLLNAFWKKIIISFVGSSAVSFQTANTIVKKQFPLLPKMPHIRVCLCQSYPLPYYSFCFVNYSIFAGSLILILVGGFNHPEKYDFVNGKDDIPYMKWKIVKKKFETTNQSWYWIINVGFQPIIHFWIIHFAGSLIFFFW